jgi:hypothetical protein
MQQTHFSASELGLQVVPVLTARFVEMIAGDGGSHSLYASINVIPDLLWHSCPDCGCWFLRLAQRRDGQLWVETLEPRVPWIRMGLDPQVFQESTQIAGPHHCRPEILVEELVP